jgi:hypothetical protein
LGRGRATRWPATLILRSNTAQSETSSFDPLCPEIWRHAMKLILSPLVLIASLGMSFAEPVDRAPPSQASSITTEYPAMREFHHNVGETSYVGYYFNAKPSNCSVIIWSKSDKETPAEKIHQKVRIDLNEKQAISFLADELGSNLSLECAPDAKSLSVRQTSVSFTQ